MKGCKKMSFINWENSIVKKFTIIDVFLIELSSLAFGVLLVALIPSLMEINTWWIVAVVILLAMKPLYTSLKKINSSADSSPIFASQKPSHFGSIFPLAR